MKGLVTKKMYWIIYREKGDKHKSERLATHVGEYKDIHQRLVSMEDIYDIIDVCESTKANSQFKENTN